MIGVEDQQELRQSNVADILCSKLEMHGDLNSQHVKHYGSLQHMAESY